MDNFYVYLSISEGIVIAGLLSWEIFWLSRMYKVLYAMPTAEQLKQMVEIMQKDGEAIRKVVNSIDSLVSSVTGVIGGLFAKSIISSKVEEISHEKI